MRTFFGFLWFLVFWIGSFVIAAVVVPQLLVSHSGAQGDYREAGRIFGKTFGPVLFLGSAAIAIIGTKTGILPGTRKR